MIFIFAFCTGFASESLTPRNESGVIPDAPPTVAAVKNPTPKIVYDEHNHERYPPGDPSKRAFAYFVLTGGRFVYASLIRLLILKFVLSMSASKDVLAMASVEVDLSGAELRRISSRQTVWTWHLFVTHRRIQKGSKTQSGSLLSGFAHIWVASPYQMLVILVGGFAPAMVPIMMSLAGFERGQHLTIWRYPLTLSWMRTNYLLVKKQWDLFRSIVAIPHLSVFFPQPKKKNKIK
ncbi:unnamed protein product, partial [Vitis vinifera]